MLAPLLREAEGRLRIHQLDVTDLGSVRAFAAAVGEEPVDVLINNAGIGGQWSPLQELDFADMALVMDTNAIGPMRLSAALLPAVLRSPTRKIVHLTTRMASLTDNTETGVYGFVGGAYAYRMSKAALNIGMRTMAVDFREQGLITAVVNPGWVKTDMGGQLAPMRREESVSNVLKVIDNLTQADNGAFMDFQGRVLAW